MLPCTWFFTPYSVMLGTWTEDAANLRLIAVFQSITFCQQCP